MSDYTLLDIVHNHSYYGGCYHETWNLVETLAEYNLMLEFLISFALKSKNNTLFFFETRNA